MSRIKLVLFAAVRGRPVDRDRRLRRRLDDSQATAGRGRDFARSDDRRPDPAHRRPCGLRASRREGRQSRGRPDQRGDPGDRRGPHGRRSRTRTIRRATGRRLGRRASWSATAPAASPARGPRRSRSRSRARSRSERACCRSRPPRPATRSPVSTTTASSTGPPPPDTFQGPTLADAIEEELGGAEGKTVNIGGPQRLLRDGLARRSARPGRPRAATVGDRRSSTTRRQRPTTPRPEDHVR